MRKHEVTPSSKPRPKTIAAVKKTNDEQRIPEVEKEAQRQRKAERTK